MTRKLFVTTALPYANAPFHIGHMMEYIQADIWVRFQRMQGHAGALRLRRRRARRADHDRRREGRQDAAGIRRRDRRRPQAVPRRLPHRASTTGTRPTRPENHELAQDIYRALRKNGLIATRDDRAVLRPGQGHVPARPLHQGRVPELRRQGPVRRHLRGLRRGLRADRAEEPVLGADRRDAGAEDAASTTSSSCRDPRCVEFLQRMDARRPAACSPRWLNKIKRVVRTTTTARRPGRLGHQPRRALLRHRDSRRAGQVLLRLARRAGRLPGLAEELLSRKTGHRLRRLPGRPGDRAGPLHRQGHHLLPHAVLAGDAALHAAARRPTTSSCTASSPSAARR